MNHSKLLVGAMAILAGCGGGTEPTPPPAASVTISPDGITLLVGGSGPLRAVVRDADGAVIAGAAVTWSTSSLSIATVTSEGTVSAHAVGQTLGIATSGDKADTAVVVVDDALTLEVKPGDTAINVLQTASYRVVATDGAGDTVPPPPVIWSSSNQAVATIDSNGVATAVGAGFTSIVATSGLVASPPAALQVTTSAGPCFGIGSAASFDATIAYGYKVVDQPTDGGFFITADDNGSLQATMTQQVAGPLVASWSGQLGSGSSASVTQKQSDGGTEVSTYTSTSGIILPQIPGGPLPSISLIVDLRQCTYRVMSLATVATILTDPQGHQTNSVDAIAGIQFAGTVPADWATAGISRANGSLGGHSLVWATQHLDMDGLMPLGFAAELFDGSAVEPPVGEASGGFQVVSSP